MDSAISLGWDDIYQHEHLLDALMSPTLVSRSVRAAIHIRIDQLSPEERPPVGDDACNADGLPCCRPATRRDWRHRDTAGEAQAEVRRPRSEGKDSGRYKVANCTQAQPVFYGFAGLPDGKVILVSVLSPGLLWFGQGRRLLVHWLP